MSVAIKRAYPRHNNVMFYIDLQIKDAYEEAFEILTRTISDFASRPDYKAMQAELESVIDPNDDRRDPSPAISIIEAHLPNITKSLTQDESWRIQEAIDPDNNLAQRIRGILSQHEQGAQNTVIDDILEERLPRMPFFFGKKKVKENDYFFCNYMFSLTNCLNAMNRLHVDLKPDVSSPDYYNQKTFYTAALAMHHNTYESTLAEVKDICTKIWPKKMKGEWSAGFAALERPPLLGAAYPKKLTAAPVGRSAGANTSAPELSDAEIMEIGRRLAKKFGHLFAG